MKRRRPFPVPRVKDLFGQVPVTCPEVVAWVRDTAGIEPESPRFKWYVRGWNVVDKIRRAKLAGEIPPA